jgi:lipopolysaccharide transport system ATP-binding protein
MTRTVVEIKNLSKKYLIHHTQLPMYTTLRETLSRKASSFLSHLKPPYRNRIKSTQPDYEEFWSLKNINLEIEEGSRVGIIGRNGAGKSTLLKILSRITEPTTGRVRIRGRVSSLLEVGTGFHPELTGRENIFLNGAILGMSSDEIKKKFDQIVSFAEVEKFLDTPVKRFSSGMSLKLAFAIAAHLDPDVLIVDEVLAVGDFKFQEKCLKKMGEISKGGRTILFVSHNTNSVLSLCDKAVFLDKGSLVSYGDVKSCVNQYLNSFSVNSLEWKGNIGDHTFKARSLSIRSEASSAAKDYFYQGEVVLLDFEGILLARSYFPDQHEDYTEITTKGSHSLTFSFDSSMFHPGDYLIKLEVGVHRERKIIMDEVVLKFHVHANGQHSKFEQDKELVCINLGSNWTMENSKKIALANR